MYMCDEDTAHLWLHCHYDKDWRLKILCKKITVFFAQSNGNDKICVLFNSNSSFPKKVWRHVRMKREWTGWR